MRGKTNIPPRKQPVINGETHNFVVAAGNTITKGDFVSYMLNNEYVQIDSRTMEMIYKNEYDAVNHKYVLGFDVDGSDPVVMLAQLVDDSVVILDSLSVAVASSNILVGIFTDGTNIYTCESVSYMSSGRTYTVKVNEYSLSNDEISFVQTYSHSITVDSSKSYSPNGFVVVDSQVWLFCSVSSSSYKTVQLFRATLGNSFSSTLVVKQLAGSVVIGGIDLSVYGSSIVCVYRYSSSNYFTSCAVISGSSVSIVGEWSSERFVVSDSFGSKMCIVTQSAIKFLEYDNGVLSVVYNGAYSIGGNTVIVGAVAQDKYVVVVGGGSTVLFEFGETIQTTENTLNSVVVGNGTKQHILSDFVSHVALECSSANGVVEYLGMIDESQGFVLGEPTNYVQEYNGGYTVGFAKTSGTGGDTIQVYTPLSS